MGRRYQRIKDVLLSAAAALDYGHTKWIDIAFTSIIITQVWLNTPG